MISRRLVGLQARNELPDWPCRALSTGHTFHLMEKLQRDKICPVCGKRYASVDAAQRVSD